MFEDRSVSKQSLVRVMRDVTEAGSPLPEFSTTSSLFTVSTHTPMGTSKSVAGPLRVRRGRCWHSPCGGRR